MSFVLHYGRLNSAFCHISDWVFLCIRLPELSVIICADAKLPGTFSMQEVMQAGESSHMKELQGIRKMLINKEPINIQFTSVSAISTAVYLLQYFLKNGVHDDPRQEAYFLSSGLSWYFEFSANNCRY